MLGAIITGDVTYTLLDNNNSFQQPYFPPSTTVSTILGQSHLKSNTLTVGSTVSNISSSSSVWIRFVSSDENFTLSHGEYDIMSENFLNFTKNPPIHLQYILNGIFMPFLLLMTSIANGLVVIVLSQREMQTPTNIVLLAMSISDLLTLMCPAPWYFYLYTLEHYTELLYPSLLCYIHLCLVDILPTIFHTASIWLTLILAGQRYIYVCHPTVAPKWCTIPIVNRAIVLVSVGSIATHLTRFVDQSYSSIESHLPDGTIVYACLQNHTQWVSNNSDLYFMIYYLVRIIFINTLPCAILVILNVLLFRALKQAQSTRAKLFNENRHKSECKRTICDTNCTTLMLIVVVSVFLATEIPNAIIGTLHVIQNSINYSFVNYYLLTSAIVITNFLISASYPLNFAIYCGMSRQFRETFKGLFMSTSVATMASSTHREGSTRYSLANGPRTSTHETVL
ncbi:sex peptide receptor-like isoform X3 [Brevipalpus obovatus]|uniref:sex peptide receptor-like isoform X3 n=1 Tax=Brevipalpus obovatus TaxID=246614 RepID=UPI003D9F4245